MFEVKRRSEAASNDFFALKELRVEDNLGVFEALAIHEADETLVQQLVPDRLGCNN